MLILSSPWNYCHDLKQGLKYQFQKSINTFQSSVANQSGFPLDPEPNLAYLKAVMTTGTFYKLLRNKCLMLCSVTHLSHQVQWTAKQF